MKRKRTYLGRKAIDFVPNTNESETVCETQMRQKKRRNISVIFPDNMVETKAERRRRRKAERKVK